MKKIAFVTGLLISFCANAQDYLTRNGSASFYSHTALEDVKANNNEVVSVLNSSTGAMDFKIAVKSFHFAKQAMEDHFNDADYISYYYKKLSALIESLDGKLEKISLLRFEQKTINQSITKLNFQLSSYMPSLKEQVNQWIEEEIKFLEAEPQELVPLKTEQGQDEKLHLSLSVAKTALLVRLMMLDKVITNRVVADVLRIMIKTVTTLQTENISFGSLETKYHDPDRGTISAVKDMLFRWINILSKL